MEVEARGTKRRRSSAGGTKFSKKGKQLPPQQVNQVKRIVLQQQESKYFTSYSNTANPGLAIVSSANWMGTEVDPPIALTIFSPVTGTGSFNIIGKKVLVTKIRISGAITNTSTTVADSSVIRLILFQDDQTDQQQAQGEELMTTTTNTNEVPFTFQNVNFFDRFKVIKDTIIKFDNPNAATSIQRKGFHWNIKFAKPVEVRFNATNGGTIADIVNNSWHILANASNTGSPTNAISYVCRTVFKDA